MAEKKITVFLYLPGEPVALPAGIFTYEGDLQIGTFAYGRKYLERKNALPVDPVALPLGLTPRAVTTNKGLYGAFRDAAPDYWGRLVIARSRSPEALSNGLLLDANATRGNLDFRTTRMIRAAFEPPFSTDERGPLGRLQRSRHEARPSTACCAGTSVVNFAQCTVEWQGVRIASSARRLLTYRVEYATMTLAERRAKFPVVPLIHQENLVLLVWRFDRNTRRLQVFDSSSCSGMRQTV
jgi:serine/threonine-protein kinase HipA